MPQRYDRLIFQAMPRRFRFLFVLSACLPIYASVASAVEVSGRAIIVDGDTMRIGTEDIRIHGIDAAETAQKCQLPKGTWDCAGAAADALAAMTAGNTVRCEGHERDQYGRLIARCSTDAEPDIGAKLVANGLAWAFVKYSADYIDLEMSNKDITVLMTKCSGALRL